MITEEGKYYLYRHIRLDKNEPFNIGTDAICRCLKEKSKTSAGYKWKYLD